MAYTFVYEARTSEGNASRNEIRAPTPAELLSEISALRDAKVQFVEVRSPDGRALTLSDIELFAEKGVIYD